MEPVELSEQARQALRDTRRTLFFFVGILCLGLLGVSILVFLYPEKPVSFFYHAGIFETMPLLAWLFLWFVLGYGLLCFVLFVELYLAHRRYQELELSAQLETALHREQLFWSFFAPLPALLLAAFICIMVYV